MNSFDPGAIFRPRSGHDLSRNVSVVSGYAFYKKSNWRKGFLHDSEIDKIFEKVISGEPKLNFSGLAGGSRTTRVHSPPDTNIHMTRRAFLSSRVIQAHGKSRACQKMGQMVQKNEDISESVNSFDTGAIFRPRSGHDLSRNVSVVSGYAFYKNSN